MWCPNWLLSAPSVSCYQLALLWATFSNQCVLEDKTLDFLTETQFWHLCWGFRGHEAGASCPSHSQVSRPPAEAHRRNFIEDVISGCSKAGSKGECRCWWYFLQAFHIGWGISQGKDPGPESCFLCFLSWETHLLVKVHCFQGVTHYQTGAPLLWGWLVKTRWLDLNSFSALGWRGPVLSDLGFWLWVCLFLVLVFGFMHLEWGLSL